MDAERRAGLAGGPRAARCLPARSPAGRLTPTAASAAGSPCRCPGPALGEVIMRFARPREALLCAATEEVDDVGRCRPGVGHERDRAPVAGPPAVVGGGGEPAARRASRWPRSA